MVLVAVSSCISTVTLAVVGWTRVLANTVHTRIRVARIWRWKMEENIIKCFYSPIRNPRGHRKCQNKWLKNTNQRTYYGGVFGDNSGILVFNSFPDQTSQHSAAADLGLHCLPLIHQFLGIHVFTDLVILLFKIISVNRTRISFQISDTIVEPYNSAVSVHHSGPNYA